MGELFKGVSQGSIRGPLLFNILSNIYFIVQCILFAMQMTMILCYIHTDFIILKTMLEKESKILISWFSDYFMNANPDKFQAIFVWKKAHENITCDKNVTLLGINADFMLKFDSHESDICKKASNS